MICSAWPDEVAYGCACMYARPTPHGYSNLCMKLHVRTYCRAAMPYMVNRAC